MTRIRPADEPGFVLVDAAFLGVRFDLLAALLRDRYRRDGIAPPRGFAGDLNEVRAATAGKPRADMPARSSVATDAATPATIEVTEWVTSTEAARRVGCSTSYINRLLRECRIQGRKVGPVWLVDMQSVTEHFRASRA